MADHAFGRTVFHAGNEVGQFFAGGEEAEMIFGKGTQILPRLPLPIWGSLGTRVVSDDGRRWFEMGFRINHELSGNAATGWTDTGNYFRLDTEWSPDLLTWSAGKFVPPPTPVVALGGGVYEYWSRALHPVDAEVKSGVIRAAYGMPGPGNNGVNGDSRNNPFTSLTVASTSLPLGGFPYTMPDDAGRMQTDLRVFYPDATVEATADTVWAITIPGVAYTSYAHFSKVSWPPYLVPDFMGNLTVTVDGINLAGNLVDQDGTIIHLRAFGRLKITPGSRYNAFA